MGYTLTIGELTVHKYPDCGLDEDGISFGAFGIHHDDAPAFGEPTDHTNSRWPSYSAWAGTMRDLGLTEVIFSGGTLVGGHPGVRLVTPELVEVVSSALEKYRREHPDGVAGFNQDENMPTDPVNANLARMEWFDYWLRWALENCDTPVIANS